MNCVRLLLLGKAGSGRVADFPGAEGGKGRGTGIRWFWGSAKLATGAACVDIAGRRKNSIYAGVDLRYARKYAIKS